MKWCQTHDSRQWDNEYSGYTGECDQTCEIVELMTRAEFIASLDAEELREARATRRDADTE